MPRQLLQRVLGLKSSPHSLAGLTRRQVLKLGLAAAGGLLSSSVLPRRSLAADKPRVLVVGAGFSGLACAYELQRVGYAVKVLEARRRVGGRVLSLEELVPGKVIEGGGEMLGSNHPHVLAYAARFGFSFRDVTDSDDPAPLWLNAMRVDPLHIPQLLSEVESAYVAMTRDAEAVVTAEPWKTPDAESLDRRTTADWIDSLEISALARRLLNVQFMADNGVATRLQSYLGNLAQVKGGGLERYWSDTEVYRLEGGNQRFATRFAQELGERVVLNCPVLSIDLRESGVRIVDRHGGVHEADDVVLATPPSTWPTIQITPALPRELVPQMGSNVKFLAVLKDPFWSEQKVSPDATSDGDINSTWHATQGQDRDGPAVLTAFSGGTSADAIHARPAPQRQPEYLREFERLYPGFGEAFVKGQFMNWVGDPWARAGYSFPAPGQVTVHGPLLQRGQGRLHFAGEHTCYAFVGYMEGALHSGEAVARRIAVRDGVASGS